MSNLLKDWDCLPLGELAEIRVSNVDKKTVPGEHPVRLCNYIDVYNRAYLYANDDYMEATATQAEIEKFRLQAGDVIITKDSETPDDIGIPAIIESSVPDLICGYHLAILRCGPKIDPTWLAKQIEHHTVARHLGRVAVGTTRYGLGASVIAKIPIRIAPIQEQRKVSSIFRTVDKAIQQTDALIAKLRQMKAGLLHDLLTRGLDENGKLRDPVAHPEQFQDSALGLIPVRWEVVELKQVVPETDYGISVSLDDPQGIPVLRMNNFKEGEVDLTELKYSQSSDAHNLLLQNLDVLFNRTNSFEHVGRTGIWRSQLPQASFASYLVRLTPDLSRLIPEFLNLWLNWEETQIRIRRYATPGVHQVNINPTNLRKVTIALPLTREEQTGIVNMIAVHDARIHAEETAREKLVLLRRGLMDDLLTGRVRVTTLLPV